MTLMRRTSPLGELVSLRHAMDRLFDDSVVRPRGWGFGGDAAVPLPLDISSTPEALIVDADPEETTVLELRLIEHGFEVRALTTTCGPGIVAVEVQEGPLEMLTYITQTPVDDEITEITIHFSMMALGDERATESIAALNDQVTNLQFTQDVPIWENKIYRERPPLTRVDGPVSQYRRWFRTFYSGWKPTAAETIRH